MCKRCQTVTCCIKNQMNQYYHQSHCGPRRWAWTIKCCKHGNRYFLASRISKCIHAPQVYAGRNVGSTHTANHVFTVISHVGEACNLKTTTTTLFQLLFTFCKYRQGPTDHEVTGQFDTMSFQYNYVPHTCSRFCNKARRTLV